MKLNINQLEKASIANIVSSLKLQGLMKRVIRGMKKILKNYKTKIRFSDNDLSLFNNFMLNLLGFWGFGVLGFWLDFTN